MKIAILILERNVNNYENIAFRTVAQKENFSLAFLYVEKITIVTTTKENSIYYEGKLIDDFDVIIPRTGSATTNKVALIINAFKNQGKVLNDGDAIKVLMNKFKTTSILAKHNIPICDSLLLTAAKDLEIAEQEFGYPMIMKSNTGSLGYGIYLINNKKEFTDLYDHSCLLDKKYFFMLQRFYDFTPGEDIRVFVVCNKIVGAMHRKSDGNDFKSNFTIHGIAEKFEVSEELEKLCLKIPEILNCEIVGIDLLKTKNGYVVCEVNSAPGFKGLQQANPGLNVVKEIYKQVKKDFFEKKI